LANSLGNIAGNFFPTFSGPPGISNRLGGKLSGLVEASDYRAR
jgi:hypothetical protein